MQCSFCGHDREQIINGPEVYICHDCVDVCLDVIAEQTGGPHPVERDAATVVVRAMLRETVKAAEQAWWSAAVALAHTASETARHFGLPATYRRTERLSQRLKAAERKPAAAVGSKSDLLKRAREARRLVGVEEES